MTATDNITLGELANQIADGTVDIQAPLERPRSKAEQRREIAKTYTTDKAFAALLELAHYGRIKLQSAATGESVKVISTFLKHLSDETLSELKNSMLTSKEVDIAVRCLRVAVDMDAVALVQEKARRAAGRYTIEEAAKELADNTGRDIERWRTTLLAQIRQGKLPLRNPRDIDDQLPYAVPNEIDFVLVVEQTTTSDLNALLENNPNWGIEYRFGTVRGHVPEIGAARQPIGLQQETAVINKIRELGMDPLSFPKNAPGKPGRKTEVRDAILKNPSHLFSSKKTFESTWDRLRAKSQIVDGPGGIPKN